MEQALVLTTRQAGEDNRIATMLSPERGVFEAMLYGGRKSRLRSMVSPWHSGKIWLYSDQSRSSNKITDFEPLNFHPSLRENLYKNMAASLVTELIIKTKAAGENKRTWVLMCGFLDGLELSEEDECKKGLVRFLWRYLEVMGERPDFSCCGECGESIAGTKAWFLEKENAFVCSQCHDESMECMFICKEAMEYLSAAAIDTGKTARTMPLSKEAENQLRKLLFRLISSIVDLKSLGAGVGIL